MAVTAFDGDAPHPRSDAKESTASAPESANASRLSNSDEELLDRLHQCDRDAMNELIQRYQELITRVASNQLGQMPRSRFDTEDVVRSAFRTFFRRATHGEYIADPKSGLRGLLSLIASAKAAKMIRDAMAGVRDYRLEVQLDERLGQLESDQARRCCSLKAQGQDYAIEVAQVVYAMCEYPEIDPVHRRYLDACMDEELKTKAAIARAMGISERVLDRVQREVQKEIERRMNN